jgi:hypothetical protein
MSVDPTSDGGCIVAGEASPSGLDDVYVIKLDAQGDLDPAWDLNPRVYCGSEAVPAYVGSYGRCVEQTSDGGYILAAEIESSHPLDPFTNERYVLLLKLAPIT